MIVAAILAGLAVALLLATLAPRLSPPVQVAATLVIGYALGYDVWHADAGPVPLTLDRLALMGITGGALWRLWRGRLPTFQPTGADWAIGLLCGWLTASCLLNRAPDGAVQEASPLFRLVVSFWAPAILFAVLRTTRIDAHTARRFLQVFACLGLYLGFTAVMETLGQWSLVFPRYIADPDLGLHFGRARGPMLNSVSLGVHLAVCCAASWLLIPRASRPMQLFWLAGCGLMSLGVLLTLTRTTWIGLAGAVVTVVCLQLPRGWRLTAFVSTCLAGALLLAVGKDAIVGLQREDSAEVSAHSAQQRLSFLYVSQQMIQDNPLLGVGFGRFFDKKLPYLTDRRQWFELESIRGLQHHNTFLSVLVETGPLGLAAFLAVLACFFRIGWRLAHDPNVGDECNRLGLLLIGAVANYLPSAAGHDLTLIHTEQWLLFAIAGAGAGCWLNQANSSTSPVRSPQPNRLASPSLPALTPDPAPPMPDRIRLFGMTIDRLDLRGATDRVLGWSLGERDAEGCRYVVTPNVDHAVMYQHDPELRGAYSDAAMVVADGAPLVAAARLLGKRLPERVAGSDLTPALLKQGSAQAATSGRKLRVFLLGAGPGVADRAAGKIERRWPGVEVVGTCCPPLGFEHEDAENERILAVVADAAPDVVLVGLGAPKQELWTPPLPRPPRSESRTLRRSDDRFPRRGKEASPAVGAATRHGVGAPPRDRASPPGGPLRPRRLGIPRPRVGRVARLLRSIGSRSLATPTR